MIAAFHGSYVQYVIYIGITEKYPRWFEKEVLDNIYSDSDRFTFWVPLEERTVDYYEKTLVEDYSVFLRKPDGNIHCTDFDVFEKLYQVFKYDRFTNSGVAAFSEDCIEYIECKPGVLSSEYPEWFYEFFTESAVFPNVETVLMFDTDKYRLSYNNSKFEMNTSGDISVLEHCVFLRNHLGEIRHMQYDIFKKHYNPGPLSNEVDTLLKEDVYDRFTNGRNLF